MLPIVLQGYQHQVIVRFVIQARRNLKGSGHRDRLRTWPPLNKKWLDWVSKQQGSQEHLDQGWQDLRSTGRQEGCLGSRRGTCPNCPEKLSNWANPPPRDSQAGSNHSDQHRPAHKIQSVSSRPTPITPTACPTVCRKWNHPTLIAHTAPSPPHPSPPPPPSQQLITEVFWNGQSGLWQVHVIKNEHEQNKGKKDDTHLPLWQTCLSWYKFLHSVARLWRLCDELTHFYFPSITAPRGVLIVGRKCTIWCDENACMASL